MKHTKKKNKNSLLMTGNEAIAEAAIQAGCRFYTGYPITPQNEIPAYMSRRMPEVSGIFIQAESELAAINMVFGAATTGALAMTTSSSPGMSLKQEGISYLAACRLPAVIVNIMRGGPGLGNISLSQADYFQATKGGGHGDYRCIVLAPASVQEAVDLTVKAFELSEAYRVPAIVLGDGMLGQMMESIHGFQMQKTVSRKIKKPWILTGAKNRKPNIIRSLLLKEGALEELNKVLQATYRIISLKERRYESLHLNDSKVVLVAYGSMARIAKQAMEEAREKGIKVGLIRPISLWPFPDNAFYKLFKTNKKIKNVLTVEMSCGQMVEDVRLAVRERCPVYFFGRSGGSIPSKEEILKKIKKISK